MRSEARFAWHASDIRSFQYSIGDAAYELTQKSIVMWIVFQYSIGDASPPSPGPPRSTAGLSILHWRCGRTREEQTRNYYLSFNTPLEMLERQHRACVWLMEDLSILHWRCPPRCPPRPAPWSWRSFQYSIGDAGGSCVWFCGFLSFCVGVCGFLAGAC